MYHKANTVGGKFALIVLALLSVGSVYAAAGGLWGGSLAYTYRLLARPQGDATQGHLTTLHLNANSYLYRPWFTTFSAGINLSFDQSQYGDVTRNNSLATGRMNLHVFPQSRFPLDLKYVRSDSRISTEIIDPAGAIFANKDDYRLQRFFLRQAFLAGNAFKMNLTLDSTNADSVSGGRFERDIVGAHFSLRSGAQHVRSTVSVQETGRNDQNSAEDNRILHLDHRYAPSNSFVVNTLVSDVQIERDIAFANADLVNSLTRASQMFSSFHWRPQTRPLLLNGGMRISQFSNRIDGDQNGNNGTATLSLNGVYQYGIRLNLNAGASLFGDTAGASERSGSDQTLGAVYRSDTYGLNAYIYNWASNINLANSVAQNKTAASSTSSQAVSGSLGQTLARHWSQANGRISVNLNQRITETARRNAGLEVQVADIQGLIHTLNLAWQSLHAAASSIAQLTASDIRDFEQANTSTQLLNLQLSRTQTLSRSSSLNANITAQYLRQVQSGLSQNALTTLSGVATYQKNRLFRVPRLHFTSRASVSRPDSDTANRGLEYYVDNQLNYDIGKLRSSLIFRVTGRDTDFYYSTFIRMTRSF